MLALVTTLLGGFMDFWGVSIIAVSIYAEDQSRQMKLVIQAVGCLLFLTGAILIHYG